MKQKLFSVFFALALLLPVGIQAVSIQKAGIENGCQGFNNWVNQETIP